MNERWFQIALGGTIGMLAAVEAPAFDPVSETRSTPQDKIQKIRFREDDDQNYMVSKVYELKHLKANDLVPSPSSTAPPQSAAPAVPCSTEPAFSATSTRRNTVPARRSSI